jgi:hypothetical protein
MPPRRAPFVGAPVTVILLARRVPGTVEEIHDGGRRLTVLTEDGDLMTFTLSRGRAHFVAEGSGSTGARLTFEDEDH